MATLEMGNEIHPLTREEIQRVVTRTSPGNYGLGYTNEEGRFVPRYVGRSDGDVGARLQCHVGKYNKFKFSYATSPKDAFEKECRNFHDFGGAEKLDNECHPDRPEGCNWSCPACNVLDD